MTKINQKKIGYSAENITSMIEVNEGSRSTSNTSLVTKRSYTSIKFKTDSVQKNFSQGTTYCLTFFINKRNENNIGTLDVNLIEFAEDTLYYSQSIAKNYLSDEQNKVVLFFTPYEDFSEIEIINNKGTIEKNSQEEIVLNCFIEVENVECQQYDNLFLNVKENSEKITQLGISGNPGSTILINGESIKMGRRGFLEINAEKINIQTMTAANPDESFSVIYRIEGGTIE